MTNSKTILLVEDDAMIALFESRVLKKNGYEVIIVQEGEKAIETVNRNENIDLILMDIDLGKGMDGTETATEILKNHDIPVVFLSSHSEPEIVEKTNKITSYGYIEKNTDETVWIASLRMAFKLHELNLKLQESEKKYRTLVEFSPEAIAVHYQGKIIYVNPEAIRIFGGESVNDFIGKPVLDFVHPDYHDIVKERVQTIYEKNIGLEQIEERFIRFDGGIIDAEVKATHVEYMGKSASLVMFHDITKHKKLEKELEKNTHNLRERIKELNCLYNISNLIEQKEISLENTLQGIVNLIPDAWQFPEITCGRIIYKNKEFITKNFRETQWKQYCKIIINKEEVGSVETFYFENKAFLKEEQDLISEISLRISRLIEREQIENERRQASIHMLIESEQRYREFIESSHDWVWEINKTGVYTYCSSKSIDILGYEPKEIIGKTHFDLMPEDEAQRLKQIFIPIFERREPFRNLENINLHKDGYTVVLETNGIPFFDNNGQFQGYRGMDRDITQNMRAIQLLSESEKKYRELVENSPDGIIVSCEDKIVFINNEAIKILGGKSQEDFINKAPRDIVHPDFLEIVNKRIKLIHQEKINAGLMEQKYVRLDGSAVDVEVVASGINYSGKPGTQVVFRDITSRKRAEEEILKLNENMRNKSKELQALNKEFESYSYTISHDLKNPVNIIDGFSNILLDEYFDKFDDDGKYYLKSIHSTASKMSQLISDILKLSKLTKGEINFQEVNLSRLAESIANHLRVLQPERNIEFIIEPSVTADADERLIKAALENIMHNAWKYTGKKDHAVIEFGVTEYNGKKTYFVKDNGAGFDMKFIDKLFVPFERLHGEKDFEGSGIGLTTVQRIIHRHGGEIWAESKPDEGATFYFWLG